MSMGHGQEQALILISMMIQKNTKAFFSKQHRNFINQRAGDLSNNINTVKEEGVVAMINDIIRLTEPKVND